MGVSSDEPRGRPRGYPEIAEAFKRYAFEEAEHAAKLLSFWARCDGQHQEEPEMRAGAESGACTGKCELAKRAKELAMTPSMTQYTMAKDEARHGAGFADLKRYFGK